MGNCLGLWCICIQLPCADLPSLRPILQRFRNGFSGSDCRRYRINSLHVGSLRQDGSAWRKCTGRIVLWSQEWPGGEEDKKWFFLIFIKARMCSISCRLWFQCKQTKKNALSQRRKIAAEILCMDTVDGKRLWTHSAVKEISWRKTHWRLALMQYFSILVCMFFSWVLLWLLISRCLVFTNSGCSTNNNNKKALLFLCLFCLLGLCSASEKWSGGLVWFQIGCCRVGSTTIRTVFTVVKRVFYVYLGLSFCADHNTFFLEW